MLFSLANLPKKSLRDADGDLAMAPRLLKGRAAIRLLEQALAWMEGQVGKARGEYDPHALEEIMGNYRMGRCIEACLLTHYKFRNLTVESVLSAEQQRSLMLAGLDNPSALRLALWDLMNSVHSGFAPPLEREALLGEFGASCGLPADPALVETLLSLDSETCAVLERTGERPAARDILLQYNRGAVKTLLAHSTHVTFSLQSVPGATLKRTYFVAKKRGVLVDVEREGVGFALTLFGPEQALGSADKYGGRLADVAISLLRSLLGEAGSEAVLAATACLRLHDREYRFHLTPETLDRLEYAPEPQPGMASGRIAETVANYSVGGAVETSDRPPDPEPLFDSLLEARMYREWKSLERQGYTHGWGVLREPDPLVAAGVVLIPDFAFRRGDSYVFMEIAGFWTPMYREKKLAKLRALAKGESANLLIAAPHDAAATYAGLPYPVMSYKNNVRATDILALLDAHYGQREKRHDEAQGASATLLYQAVERGFIAEREVADALQAYSRTELLGATSGLDSDETVYVAGVGLFRRETLAEVEMKLRSSLADAGGKAPLEDVAGIAAAAIGVVEIDLESLIRAWPDMSIDRPSLFEAYLVSV